MFFYFLTVNIWYLELLDVDRLPSSSVFKKVSWTKVLVLPRSNLLVLMTLWLTSRTIKCWCWYISGNVSQMVSVMNFLLSLVSGHV